MAEILDHIDPELIQPNPENPRQVFREDPLDALAASIDEKGVLVPVYVYREGDTYYLIDGERRWMTAKRLGLSTIPAIVRDDPPEPARNLIEMFHIHQIREEWEDMPTAIALKAVMDRLGTDDDDTLRRETGLSREQIRRYKLVLELPQPYQDMIRDGDLPMNFFVELDDNVIRPLARRRAGLAAEFPPDAIRDSFIAKRESGTLSDVISLRRVKPIITYAGEDAGSPDAASDFDPVLRNLFEDAATSVDDAYEQSVAMLVEANQLSQHVGNLIRQVDRLIDRVSSADERDLLLDLVQEASEEIQARLDRLSGLTL